MVGGLVGAGVGQHLLPAAERLKARGTSSLPQTAAGDIVGGQQRLRAAGSSLLAPF
jgi:ABC-type iron transport system FetAB permease component